MRYKVMDLDGVKRYYSVKPKKEKCLLQLLHRRNEQTVLKHIKRHITCTIIYILHADTREYGTQSTEHKLC